MATKKGGDVFAPARKAYILSSGRPVEFVQPNLLALASGKIDLPNLTKQGIWNVLMQRLPEDSQQQLLADERWAHSHFAAAQLVLFPRLRLDEEDEEGVIDPVELSMDDLVQVYFFLHRKTPQPAQDRQLGTGETLALSGDGVPPATE